MANAEQQSSSPRSRGSSERTKASGDPVTAEVGGAESVGAQTSSARSAGGDRAGAGDRAGNDDDTLVGSATRLVGQAASVLEKELAAGIAAVRSLEQRHLDVDPLRKRDPEDVMHRFRRDAHEVVDLLMDLVQVAARSAGGLAERAVRISGTSVSGVTTLPAGGIPTLETAGQAAPGETVTLEMALENAGESSVEAVNFIASDLVTPSGLRIAASDIRFSPDEVTIEPSSKTRVQVSVKVPADARPGVYSGMLIASKLEQVRAVLCVRVKAPEIAVDDAPA